MIMHRTIDLNINFPNPLRIEIIVKVKTDAAEVASLTETVKEVRTGLQQAVDANPPPP